MRKRHNYFGPAHSGHTYLGYEILEHNYLRHHYFGHIHSGHTYLSYEILEHNCLRHHYFGHTHSGHTYLGHRILDRNYLGHTELGHTYLGREIWGHNYLHRHDLQHDPLLRLTAGEHHAQASLLLLRQREMPACLVPGVWACDGVLRDRPAGESSRPRLYFWQLFGACRRRSSPRRSLSACPESRQK